MGLLTGHFHGGELGGDEEGGTEGGKEGGRERRREGKKEEEKEGGYDEISDEHWGVEEEEMEPGKWFSKGG